MLPTVRIDITMFGTEGGKHGGSAGKAKTLEVPVIPPTAEELEDETVEKGVAAAGTTGSAMQNSSVGGDAALITGCQDNETSQDCCPFGDVTKAYGALTNSIINAVKTYKAQNPNTPMSNKVLVTNVRRSLLLNRFQQNPCLECADGTVAKPFIC
jgi:hypothetical protein